MRILLTAGPTWEPIDAVRYIGNRSSGKLGLAVARAAVEAGHAVTLLLGPGVAAPEGMAGVHRFESCADLQHLLETHFPQHDVLIMAAAVADYRPARCVEGKLRRQEGGGLALSLEPTPDLVAAAVRGKRTGQRVIAFALEEAATLHQGAEAKLRRKGADAIVANPLGTMAADDVEPLWLTAAGDSAAPGKMSKPAFARWLLARIEWM